MIDRKLFFDRIRAAPANGFLGSSQVDGFTRILDEWERRGLTDARWLSYMLATCWHETAKSMQPIKEFGGDSYLKSKPYYPWYGRGLVQCTWEPNFKKFGCSSPNDMLTWPFALRAMFDGMMSGIFTGRKLSQYFNATVDDPFGARHIINGTDKAGLIAGYNAAFLAAIDAAKVVQPINANGLTVAGMAAKIAAAAPPIPSPGPIPGLGRIPEPPSLLPPGFIAPKVPPAPYTPPAVSGPHLVPAVSRPGFWARIKAAFGGRAA